MNLKPLGLAALVSGVLATGNANAQCPNHQPFLMPQFYLQTFIIQPVQPVYVHPSITSCPRPIQYRTWPHLDELIQAKPEELPLSLKYLEPGFYQTIIEKGDVCYVLGGLDNMFKMVKANDGYIKPKNEQGICWNVLRQGTFELYAVGNDKCLKLGVVQLDAGDKIRFHKIAELDSTPTITSPQQPTLAPQQPTLAPPKPN